VCPPIVTGRIGFAGSTRRREEADATGFSAGAGAVVISAPVRVRARIRRLLAGSCRVLRRTSRWDRWLLEPKTRTGQQAGQWPTWSRPRRPSQTRIPTRRRSRQARRTRRLQRGSTRIGLSADTINRRGYAGRGEASEADVPTGSVVSVAGRCEDIGRRCSRAHTSVSLRWDRL